MSRIRDLFNTTMDRVKDQISSGSKRQSQLDLIKADKPWLDLQYHDFNRTSIKRPQDLESEMQEPPSSAINKYSSERTKGSMVGMALGAALGAHVQFRPRQYMVANPVIDLEGGGIWGLKKGQFTDDTSMALCLAVSLVTQKEFRLYDQLVRYKWWFRDGYMSSTGACFEIGQATSESLQEFERRQVDFARQNSVAYRDMDNLSSGEALRQFNVYCSKEGVADNGALMRLAPVPLFFHRYPEYAVEYSGRSGQITHGDVKAYDACRYYGALIVAALRGYRRDEILDNRFYSNHAAWFKNRPLCPEVREVAEGSYKRRGGYKDGIRGKGYIVNALEAALWAFWSDENSFEKGALAAVNLGDDTDATAAIYGQLAGAYYGYDKLPCHWVKHLYAKRFIVNLSKWITYEGEKSPPTEVLPTYTPLVSSQLPAIDINKNKSRSNVNPVHNENAASKRNVTAYHDKKQDRKAMKRQQLRPTASETSLYSWVQSNSNPQDTDSHQPSQTDELKAKQPLVKSNSIARSTRNKTTRFQLDTSVPLKKPPTQNNNHGLPLRHVRTVSSMMEYFPSSAPNKNQMPAIPVDNKPSPTSKPPNAALNIRLHSKNINPVQVSSNNPLSFHSPTIVECSSKTTSQLNKSDSKYRLLDTTNINTRLNSSSASGEFQTQLSYLATTAEAQYAPDASITNILISDALPDLNQCLSWSCKDVCNWIISLGEIYVTYTDSFKRHNINGYRLITFVDRETLIELGVNSSHNRHVILDGIKQLQNICKSSLPSNITGVSNIYNEFDGDFVLSLRLSDTIYPNTLSCVLKPLEEKSHSKLYTQIVKWVGPLPPNVKIDRIELVHNADSYLMFLQQIKRTESRQAQPEFLPHLDKEKNLVERKRVLNRLQNLTQHVRHNRSAAIVRVWHGCHYTNIPKLLSGGFAVLGTLDNGWFGKGMYFTSSAEYAAKYTKSNGCLIMCYVIVLNPFPVITDDAPPDVSSTNFRFYGSGNYSNYQCHYIPVANAGASTSLDFRPPPNGVQDATYDELAVFQQTEILPQVIVHLKTQCASSSSVAIDEDLERRFLSKE